MNLTISYNILFEVKILHHYFLNRGEDVYDRMGESDRAKMMLNYDAREIFEIRPSPETSRILESHKCIFKRTTTGFLAGMRAEPNNDHPPVFKPFHSPSGDLTFTFYLNIHDPGFLNYTALPMTGIQGKVYVFQNMTGIRPRKFPSLCATAPVYDAAGEYLPGEMLVNNAGNPTKLFTARVKTKKTTSTASDWLTELKSDGYPVFYANTNDLYPLVRGLAYYRVKTAGTEPSATVRTTDGTLITPVITLLKGDFNTIQADMRRFPEGFYTMQVRTEDLSYDDTFHFFLIQQKESPFGILQLSVKSDDPLFDMLDATGIMNSPVYELRFRNRATHWRYIGKKFNDGSVTQDPFPLTRHGFIENVTVKDKDGNDADDLPNPSVAMIRTEAITDETEKRYYSEIHIH